MKYIALDGLACIAGKVCQFFQSLLSRSDTEIADNVKPKIAVFNK
jgi:hypothetical protein